MTVSSTTTETRYAGDDTSVDFATGFTFYAASTLVVSLVYADTGTETVQALTTNYTVTGGVGATGSVHFLVAPPVGTTVVVRRDEPYTQLTDLGTNDPLRAEVLELTFDKTVMQIQQNKGLANNALRVTDGPIPAFPVAALRALKLAAFDTSGNPVVTSPLVVTAQVEFATRTDATLATVASAVTYLRTNGYTTVGDNGGGLYKKVVSQPAHLGKLQTLDGAWWELSPPEGYSRPEQFGWVPGADIALPLRSMITFASLTQTKDVKLFRDPSNPGVVAGAYRAWTGFNINTCIQMNGASFAGIRLLGLGRELTRIEYDHVKASGVPRSILGWTGSNPYIQGIAFDGREQDRVAKTGLILASDINNSATTITLTDATNINPSTSGGTIKIDNEWIFYTSKSGNDLLTCQRGIRGTTAASHTAGATIFHQWVSGNHVLSISNFTRAYLRDVASINSIAYGIGIENTGVLFIEHLDLQDIYVENAGSDGIDIKCPVQNGNKYAVIRNYTVRGWARESTWGFHTNDNGIDCRLQGARIEGFLAIYEPYQGKSTGINMRDNQVTSGVPVGDFSGAHFTQIVDAHFLGWTAGGGTATVQHNGIVCSSGHNILNGIDCRNLTGDALSITTTAYDCLASNVSSYLCNRGVAMIGNNNMLQHSKLIGSITDGLVLDTGTGNVVNNVECTNSGAYGVHSVSGAVATLTNVRSTGSVTADYLMAPTIVVRKNSGASKTVATTYTALPEDYLILADATSAAFTVSLPHASQVVPGREYIVKKIDASGNAVTVDTVGAFNIEGGMSSSLAAQWNYIRVLNNGAKWFKVG